MQVEEQRRLAFQERERLAELPPLPPPAIEFEELPQLAPGEPGVPPLGELSPADFAARQLTLDEQRANLLYVIEEQEGPRYGGKPVRNVRFEAGKLLGTGPEGVPLRAYLVRNTDNGRQRVYWTPIWNKTPPAGGGSGQSASTESTYEELNPGFYEVEDEWDIGSLDFE
jgi:hypothetical protein